MALIKKIELSNGVTVNYHRVVSVFNITNHACIIEIASYPNKEKRKEEILALSNNDVMNVFINTERISIPYDQYLNVVSAYDYLKTTEKYGGAKNA